MVTTIRPAVVVVVVICSRRSDNKIEIRKVKREKDDRRTRTIGRRKGEEKEGTHN